MLICFALCRFVIGLQVSRHPFNQSVAPLKLSTSGSVTSFCSRRRILTMASWGEHTVKVFLANGFWSSLIKMLFGLHCRMEWLQQGSRELFGTIIEDQVCAGFSLKNNPWLWWLCFTTIYNWFLKKKSCSSVPCDQMRKNKHQPWRDHLPLPALETCYLKWAYFATFILIGWSDLPSLVMLLTVNRCYR